ncbi:MAG: trypsin-like peptidase domain-containing protein [Acidobacteria bacterium]|nr:trypsin-like peptidase domain-containing protein [Acidobacteriota bacterium]
MLATLVGTALGIVLTFLLFSVGNSRALEERHFLGPPPPLSTEGLNRDERAIVRAFERVNHAVVVLETEETDIAQEDEALVLAPGRGLGSGVVISDEGEILTAAHVVSGVRNAKAWLVDGSEVGVDIVFADTASDLAVLRLVGQHPPLHRQDPPHPPLARHRSPAPGDVRCLGCPGGSQAYSEPDFNLGRMRV